MLLKWNQMAVAVDTFKEEVNIAVVGKYTGLSDAYLSVIKALKHSAIAAGRKLNISWVEATDLEVATSVADKELYDKSWATVRAAHGVHVPGGFGNRGVEGKILAANYARTSKTPYLGVCLGMQCAVIEYARNMCQLSDANSAEFDDNSKNPVIIFMPEINPDQMGGTMRLGERATVLKDYEGYPNTIATTLYGNVGEVDERHRHRYEVNPEYVPLMEQNGLMFTGVDDRNQRMEIIELREKDHPFYLGCQYHPEFKTVVGKPSPPFYGFILASSGQYKGVGKPLPSNDQFRDLLASPKAITKRNAESPALSSSDSSAKRARRS
jgi:CTP synthase